VRRAAVLVVLALSTGSALFGTQVRAAQAADATARRVLDVGDSLSVGTAPYLAALLRGYHIDSVHDVGLHAYDASAVVGRSRRTLPPVVLVSAGSNDDPRIVSTFVHAVTSILDAAGPERCVVWPTIVRPPAVGSTYDGFNRALRRAAARHPNLVLVDWVGMVRRHPRWLAPDGVHAGALGYRARAAAIATAVATTCPRVVR
jgi:lysophospholipase L1-like esterase